MSTNLLLNTGDLEIRVSDGEMSPHLFKSLGGDGVNSELLLALSKTQPKLTPGGMSGTLAEQVRHGSAAVAGGQRGLVAIVLGVVLSLELLELLLQLLDLLLVILGHVGYSGGDVTNG